MKQYYLQIRSKNEKSLQHFFKFFFKNLKTKISIFSTLILNRNSKKIITLLKSPHVNKTAQEHFGLHLFANKLLLKSFNLKINSIFLKKVLKSLFHDVSINLKFMAHLNNEIKNNITVFYLDNFKIFKVNRLKSNKKRYLQKRIVKKIFKTKRLQKILLNFLNLISMFGEILLLNSSKVV
jgi:ribosomal protein S10